MVDLTMDVIDKFKWVYRTIVKRIKTKFVSKKQPEIEEEEEVEDIQEEEAYESEGSIVSEEELENELSEDGIDFDYPISNIFNSILGIQQAPTSMERAMLEAVNLPRPVVKQYQEFDTFKTLIMNVTNDEKKTIVWLHENEFIAKQDEDCPKCASKGKRGKLRYKRQGVRAKQRRKGGIYLQCSSKHRFSPFNGTFFDGNYCKIPCNKVLDLIYLFAWKTPVLKAARELKINANTAIDYYNYLREVCTNATASREDHVIGGPGLTVEIDESKFFRRKYNRGRILPGSQKDGWVFGGICRETKEIFMVRVADRTKPVLFAEIKKHIREGTNIVSDEWAAYRKINEIEDRGYTHQTICHKRNFVSPDDPLVHTQNIECQWKYAKRCFPANSTSLPMRDSYLQEYLYRQKHGKFNMVHQLLEDIKMLYPFKITL